LVIALYWRRRNALCESDAHHALVDALHAHNGEAAAELMREHLRDLVTQLDLRDQPEQFASLKDALISP
jgi:DNA-binding GntR family transcriptional regulator